MALKVELYNSATSNVAKINGEGELGVVVHPHPPIDEEVSPSPFRQYFTNDGSETGSNNMLVDGSVTNAPFYIKSRDDHDIYIKTVSVIIADVNATLNKFGNIAALTNGIEFIHETQDAGSIVIHEGLKSNWDFIRIGLATPAFGATTNAFRASNISGASEGYSPIISMSDTFGLVWGLRLRKGTNDRLSFIIKDDVSTIDAFNIIAYGIKI